jgi:hypothetical protein
MFFYYDFLLIFLTLYPPAQKASCENTWMNATKKFGEAKTRRSTPEDRYHDRMVVDLHNTSVTYET